MTCPSKSCQSKGQSRVLLLVRNWAPLTFQYHRELFYSHHAPLVSYNLPGLPVLSQCAPFIISPRACQNNTV